MDARVQCLRWWQSLPLVSLLSTVLILAPFLARPAGASGTMPADGRLRGPDFAAVVTNLAWPDQYRFAGKIQEPPTGRRFVVFDLTLSERSAALSPEATSPLVAGAVQWPGSSVALAMGSIDSQIESHALGSAWASATASFVATVSNTTHDVNLVLTEGTFSQSFNLWTLRRDGPAPAVLYRDPSYPSLSGTATAPTTLTLSNSSDGFTNISTVNLQSATLSNFAPRGDAVAPMSPEDAVLSVVLDGEYSENPNDRGHYLGSESPLPGSMLTFTPNGGTAVGATLSDSGDANGKGHSDDGLFDATYSFVVPASLVMGTLTVASGPFTGAEFTTYTPESGTTTLDVAAAESLAVSFPPVPTSATQQKTPPWVGQPVPATQSEVVGGGRSGWGGFPVWLAVALLAALAAAVVLVQRMRRRPAPETASPQPTRPYSVTQLPANPVVGTDLSPAAGVASQDIEAIAEDAIRVNVMGPRQIVGLRQPPERRVVEELLVYLAFHNRHHMRAEQIQLGMWPTSGSHGDVNRKTFHNYLSLLRQSVGAHHLPDASGARGYLLVGVETDWEVFGQLNRQADATGGVEARALRAKALQLVRGVPFQDVPAGECEWVAEEHLGTTMAVAIANCAQLLSADLLESGDPVGAQAAVGAGLRGAPDDFELWSLGARTFMGRGDRTGLRRWLTDAAAHLEPADIERIESTLVHQEPSE